MPFQAKGAALLARSPRAMLAWDPGVGKTPTAVRACLLASAARILVFCPPIAASVWRTHFADWSDIEDIRVAGAVADDRPHAFTSGCGARIIPFSRARSGSGLIGAAIRNSPWDIVVIDEAHYLKSPGAQRTRAVYGERIDLKGSPLERARHVWCLTGTPLLNHPAEFWTHLRALAPDTIILPGFGVMTESVFTDRFCVVQQTPFGVRIRGGRNTFELGQRVGSFVDRKRLKDVILDMPDLRIVEHALPADTPIAPSLRLELSQAMSALGIAADTLGDDQLLASIQAGGVAFSTLRRLIGRAKVEAVAELVADELDDARDDKVIVFAHHREVIEGLAQRLKRFSPLVIHGGTPLKARDIAIEMFQNDDGRRLIVLAIEAAGEVITLHASRNVIIAEPSPVPAKNRQAIARAHRKGQKSAVLARFVLLPGTLDARLMSIVARKTRDIAQIVDGVQPPRQEHAFPDAS
jgi:SWI/SNF-related matrix-associated actin-dependent regulator 1 of chromatin subfamily A